MKLPSAVPSVYSPHYTLCDVAIWPFIGHSNEFFEYRKRNIKIHSIYNFVWVGGCLVYIL